MPDWAILIERDGWTIEERGHWWEGEGPGSVFAVIDEDGAEIEFFRLQEDAEEWLANRLRTVDEVWPDPFTEVAG